MDLPHIFLEGKNMIELQHRCLCGKKVSVEAELMIDARKKLDEWKETHECEKRGMK